jgi:GNAT superfamily N-acetyltransferase
VEVIEFGRLTPQLRAELEGDEDDPFDMAGSTLHYRAKEQHVALRAADGRLAASTGLVPVELEAGRVRFAAVGLGGVIVVARYRGQGLARRIVSEALARARTLGPDFAILFCREDRSGLYLKLGFADVGPDVLAEQPGGYVPVPLRMMWFGLTDGAVWPPGAVVLHGLPF